MLMNNDFKAVCSVTELAKNLDMSRARFYQLQKMGVFPEPVYCIRTKRPFYPLDLQQRCIEIRKTGIGHNGQPIIFYRRRKNKPVKPQNQLNADHKQLVDTLRQLGLKITASEVKSAVSTLYPQGTVDHDGGAIVRGLFRHFRQGV
ncbi:MAG: hypothetical protein DRP56_00795 [Planctomycetota bacterium]|nr:MAG: hypothetical protein DRP56_00795 [Planctomycetota bacterium]